MKYFSILAVALLLTGCGIHCRDGNNCTRLCEDGTPANIEPPYCPLNERDMLPPANDNVGLKGIKKDN